MGRLAALSLLAGDGAGEVPHRCDFFTLEYADGRFPAVHHDEPERLAVDQHLVELVRLEVAATSVAVGDDGLGRLDDDGLHGGAVAADGDRAAENGHAVQGRLFVVFQAGHNGLEGALDVVPGRFGFDVGGRPVLVPEVRHHIRYPLFVRNIQGD